MFSGFKAKRAFYCVANAIFDRMGRHSELESTLTRGRSCNLYMPVLFCELELCILTIPLPIGWIFPSVGFVKLLTRNIAVAETADRTAYDALITDHIDNNTLLFIAT